jgi:hypothetical protein
LNDVVVKENHVVKKVMGMMLMMVVVVETMTMVTA